MVDFVNPGRHSFVFCTVCDEDIYRAFAPEDLANTLRRELELRGISMMQGPPNCPNPLSLAVQLHPHATNVYEIVVQTWFQVTQQINLDEIFKSFINAWNMTIGSRNIDFLFPGSYRAVTEYRSGNMNPDYSLPISVIRSGSSYVCASVYASGGIAGSIVGAITGLLPANPIYQVTYERETISGNSIPVWGVGNWFDRTTMSNVLSSNLPRLVGNEINPLNVSTVSRDAARVATDAVTGAASGVADGVKSFVGENLPNILPISNNEFQTLKTVAVTGAFIFGGFLLLSAINKGLGTSK